MPRLTTRGLPRAVNRQGQQRRGKLRLDRLRNTALGNSGSHAPLLLAVSIHVSPQRIRGSFSRAFDQWCKFRGIPADDDLSRIAERDDDPAAVINTATRTVEIPQM